VASLRARRQSGGRVVSVSIDGIIVGRNFKTPISAEFRSSLTEVPFASLRCG
jgi:hypothetical protein